MRCKRGHTTLLAFPLNYREQPTETSLLHMGQFAGFCPMFDNAYNHGAATLDNMIYFVPCLVAVHGE